MSEIQDKPSALKREPALQNMKYQLFSIFVGPFCPTVIELIESGSETLD
jgi:hypothetical protein